MRSRLGWVLLGVGLAGCVGDVEGNRDGGARSSDAGSRADAGMPVDAGNVADSGRFEDGGDVVDAGTFTDAGGVSDAGSLDAGYTLTLALYGSGQGTVTGTGGLSCAPTCSATLTAGTAVTLTAHPSGNSSVVGWGGACSGTSTTCAFTLSADASVRATFNPPSSLPGVYTWRYDATRQGQNVSEATLTTSNVNSTQFGQLAALPIDGFTYAQPLYVSGVNVPNVGVVNVVYVATEHDSVFAFDADGASTNPLWQDIFINPPNVTTVPAADTGETGDLIPEHGINGTPVIDPATSTLYVVVNTKEPGPVYPYRLHALDLATGAEKFGGPVEIQATSGSVTFDPLPHMQRPGLLLLNGVVYIGFGSHGDNNTYQGWVMGYDQTTLAQVSVYCTAPSSSGDAIWQSGAGLIADSNNNIFFEVANGQYDGTNMGDSVVRLSTASGLTMADWFTPSDQANMQANDYDLGSSGAILLPSAVGSTAHPHLLLATGKPGNFYLLDQTSLGQYQSGGNDTQIVQKLAISSSFSACVTCGVYNTPAFWNGGSAATGTIYVAMANSESGTDVLRSFAISNGSIAPSPAGNTATAWGYPGVGPVISSLGTANGILWFIEVDNYTPITPAVLRAFDATNLSNPLYDSTQAGNGRDTAGLAVKFTVPLVVNGKVYVGSQTTLGVYGLLP